MSAESPGIEAKLSAFDTAMIVVSLVVGIGIFRTPAIVAREAGSTPLFFAAWAVGGLIALVGAFLFAEIGSRHPRAGGYYRVVADCYSPVLAFMLNWAHALMQGAGAAGVAFIGAQYLAPGAWFRVALAMMAILLMLNFLGIRAGARTQNVLSGMKIVLIAGLAAAGLFLAPHAASPLSPAGLPSHFLGALVPVFYAFGGYQMTMNLGADVRDAPRRFPPAIAGGMAVVAALYLAINLANAAVLGVPGVARADLVAAALARASFGPVGAGIVSVAIFLSAAGFVNATILQMPRAYYAMAQDGVLPAAFKRVNARTQVQPAGLAFFGATMILPAFLLGSFEKLLDYVVFTDSVTLVVVASTIAVLRARDRERSANVFRMVGFPWLPGIYVLCMAALCVELLATRTAISLAGVVVFLTGWPLFRLGRRATGAAKARKAG